MLRHTIIDVADSELWAKFQTEDEDLNAILGGKAEFSRKLSKVQIPDVKTLLNLETSG